MNIFEEYHAYLADNPKGYWFKRKPYGFGWTPARWQGWLLTIVYLAFIFGLVFFTTKDTDNLAAETLLWPIIGATLLFLAVCWRTGEPLKWQWGLKKRSDSTK